MNLRKLTAALAFAIGATFAATAIATPIDDDDPNLVTNGGFETGDFSGWTTVVDPFFTGVDGVAAHSGDFGAYFGDFGTPGSISQSIATEAGYYRIQLWLRSDGLVPSSFDVLWGGNTVYSAINLGASAYTEIFLQPLALTGLTTLELRARNDGGFLEVDDIAVTRVLSVPGSLALVGTGLLGLAIVRRRKA